MKTDRSHKRRLSLLGPSRFFCPQCENVLLTPICPICGNENCEFIKIGYSIKIKIGILIIILFSLILFYLLVYLQKSPPPGRESDWLLWLAAGPILVALFWINILLYGNAPKINEKVLEKKGLKKIND